MSVNKTISPLHPMGPLNFPKSLSFEELLSGAFYNLNPCFLTIHLLPSPLQHDSTQLALANTADQTALLPVSAHPFPSPSGNTAVLQPQQHQTIPQRSRLTLLSPHTCRCWKLPCSISGSLVILLPSQVLWSLPKDPVAISTSVTFQF